MGRNTTATTYNIAGTNSTCTFYEEESDGYENGNTVDISPSLTFGVTVGDAISTIATEMAAVLE
jgi:hypothetical protein